MLPRDPSNRPIQTRLSRVRMLLGCGLCACFAWLLVWYSHRPGSWQMNHDLAKLAFLCFAPLALLTWSLLPASIDQRKSYRVTRRLILLYAAVALIIAVASMEVGWIVPAGVGALTGLVLIGLGPWRLSAGNLHCYRKSLLFSNGAVIAGLLLWSFANIGLVVWGAAGLAAEKPYCVQVAKGFGGYEEAGRLLDLRALRMYAPDNGDGVHYSFHAVLAVRNEQGLAWYNWSYRHLRFMPISQENLNSTIIGLRGPVCTMRPHFLRGLSFF